MRTILLAGVLLLIALACNLSTKDEFTTYSRGSYQSTEAATAKDSIPNATKAFVSVEILLFAVQAEKYPVTTDAFKKAMKTWSDNLPVRISVYIEDPKKADTLFPGPSFLNRHNIIQVLMDDLQLPLYSMPNGLLGLWEPNNNRMLLDADTLEADPDLAYSVCLHELGHMFGVPHVVGYTQSAPTGFLVLEEGIDARSYVMYPHNVKDQKQDKLSPVEITMAQQYILYYMTHSMGELKKDSCELTTGQ